MSELADLFASIKSVQELATQTQTAMAAAQATVNVQAEQTDKLRNEKLAADTAALGEQRKADQTIVGLLKLDPAKADYAVANLLSERATLEAKQSALYKEIEQKQSVKFLDDPLAWVNARYTIDDSIDAHNLVSDRKTTVTNTIEALNVVANASKAAAYTGLAATNAIVQDQQAKAMALAAAQEADKARKELAMFNISALGSQLSAAGERAKFQSELYNTLQSDKMRAMTLKAQQMQITEFEQRQKERGDWMTISTGVSKYFGGRVLSPEFIQRMYSMSGQEGAGFRDLANSVISGGPIGKSPGEAFISLSTTGAVLANKEQASVLEKLNSDLASGKVKMNGQPVNAIQWKQMGRDGQIAILNAHVQQEYGEAIKNGTMRITQDSIYGPTSYHNLSDMMPDIGTIPLWSYLDQQPRDARLDYEVIRSTAIQAIKDGKYGATGQVEKAAEDIRKIYDAQVKYIGEVRGLNSVFGLPHIGKSYKIPTGQGMLSSRVSVVDTLSLSDIIKDLLSSVAPPRMLFSSIPSGRGGVGMYQSPSRGVFLNGN